MYKQSDLFKGMTSLPPTTSQKQNPLYVPFNGNDGRKLMDNEDLEQWHNAEMNTAQNTTNGFWRSGLIQQKAGLGVYKNCIPTNFIGIQKLPYRGVPNMAYKVVSGLGNVNSSSCVIPPNKILERPKNPIKFGV